MSIAFAGVGVGSIIMLPFVQRVIEWLGWHAACLGIGVLAVLVLGPINLLLRRWPEDIGLLADGDAINWRAYPERNPFIDGRKHLFPTELLDEQKALRKAFKDNDVDAWRAILDKYGVSAIMVELRRDTYLTEPGGPPSAGLDTVVAALASLVDAVS